MATTTLSNEEILEAIGNKTVVELAELIEGFKAKFNVTIAAAAPAAAAVGGAGGGAAAAAPAEEKTEWTVVLKEGASTERLLDEIRIFVRRLKDGLGPRARSVVRHPADLRLEGRRVLVVDDDMRTVYALSSMLRSKGADVEVADTGRAAVDLLSNDPGIDVVLMDVMMPEMDGLETMRRIRANPRFGSLPMIALTAKAMQGDREQCIEAGASDYITKPVDS